MPKNLPNLDPPFKLGHLGKEKTVKTVFVIDRFIIFFLKLQRKGCHALKRANKGGKDVLFLAFLRDLIDGCVFCAE